MIRRVLFAAMLVLAAPLALAAEFQTGDLRIIDPAVRATPSGAKVGAGYLTIRNSGASPDRLVRVESSAAARVDLHTTSHEGDVVRMHEREGGLALSPGSEVRLSPGGDHLMFVDLKAPFTVGEAVAATLVFERAGPTPVTFTVEPIGGRPA